MKKLLYFILLFQMTAHAAFDDLGVGARAPGMADAFVAVADDANALYYNPAGLVQLGEAQITTQYGQLLKGLNDGSTFGTSYLGYAFPLKKGFPGTMGVAYHNFQASNLFDERTLYLSYGWKLKIEPFGWRGLWSAGTTLKQMHRQFQPDRFTENALNDAGTAANQQDPLFAKNGYASTAYGVDVGGLYQFGPQYRYSAGVTIVNLNQPDVSIGGDKDKPPLITKFGLAYRPNWGLMTTEIRKAKRISGQADTDVAFGAERNFSLGSLSHMIMRGGYAEGSRDYKAVTAGLSYIFHNIQLDYAFSFPIGLLSDTQGSHRIGISFRMGGTLSDVNKKDEFEDVKLLSAFKYDSFTTYLLLDRMVKAHMINQDQVDLGLLLLMRKYTLDDPGFDGLHERLRLALKNNAQVMEWPELKFKLLRGLSAEDKSNANEALELFVKENGKYALARLALLSPSGSRTELIQAIRTMSLGGLAAQAYRKNNIDECVDLVRQLVEIMPDDKIVLEAYRQLLIERTRQQSESLTGQRVIPMENLKVTPEIPEAPQTLVAPKPVDQKETAPAESKFDSLVKSFNTALGYYFTRKAEGASVEEKKGLLNQMKAMYGETPLNLSLVDNELAALVKEEEKPVVVTPAQPKPVKETPKVKAATPVVKKQTPVARKYLGPGREAVTEEVRRLLAEVLLAAA